MDMLKTDVEESLHLGGHSSTWKIHTLRYMMYTSPTLLQLRCNLYYLTIAFDYTYLLGHKLIYEGGSFIFLQEDLNFLLVGFFSF